MCSLMNMHFSWEVRLMFRFKTFLEQTDMTHAKNKDKWGFVFCGIRFRFRQKRGGFSVTNFWKCTSRCFGLRKSRWCKQNESRHCACTDSSAEKHTVSCERRSSTSWPEATQWCSDASSPTSVRNSMKTQGQLSSCCTEHWHMFSLTSALKRYLGVMTFSTHLFVNLPSPVLWGKFLLLC